MLSKHKFNIMMMNSHHHRHHHGTKIFAILYVPFVPIVENGVFFVTRVSLFHYVFISSRAPPTIANQIFLFALSSFNLFFLCSCNILKFSHSFAFLSWVVESSILSTIILNSRIVLEFEHFVLGS